MQLVLPVMTIDSEPECTSKELFNPHWTWSLLILSYLDLKSSPVGSADMHRELSFCQSDRTDLGSVRLASQLHQLVKLEYIKQQSGGYTIADRGRELIDEFHAFDRHIQQEQWDWRRN